jgi:aminoglycoside phosphotransferase family enzyme/predicted kinase
MTNAPLPGNKSALADAAKNQRLSASGSAAETSTAAPLASLIAALAKPAAYPDPANDIQIRQTHISVVFLAGAYAYKIKKPVAFGFVDFSTLERRRHFCEEEIRLNRRLAPDVYLDVVPITREGSSAHVGGRGEVVEWAVKMRRLPEEATLHERLQRDELDPGLVERFARRLAGFHRDSAAAPVPAQLARFAAVAGNVRGVFSQASGQIGTTVSRPVLERLRTLLEQALARWAPLIEGRAARGMTRDTHGDLHLDHVYWFPEQPPPGDLVIVDCIEFSDRFRFIDPVADMAFAYMDFLFHGRADLAKTFAAEYFRVSGDEEGRALLPLYAAYRAAVRGAVEGLHCVEAEISDQDKAVKLEQARRHWLLALAILEEPALRPCLVLVGGLPGTGKSTLAHGLASRAGFAWVRSDQVRKELADLSIDQLIPEESRAALYHPDHTERTYRTCLERATELLFDGNRVLVDATFWQERHRCAFLDAARARGVPAVVLLCRADPEAVRERLASRHGDVSDADWSIYLQMRERWEKPEASRPHIRELPPGDDAAATLDAALHALQELGLWPEEPLAVRDP